LCTAPLLADTSDTMVESLMKLRAEVEALHSEIEYAEDGYRTSMKSLALQKNDFEAQINRQEIQLKKIDQEIAQIKEMIAKRSSKTDGLQETATKALATLELLIETGIPFKTGLRLSDIREIRTQLEGGLITAEQAVARIWGSYDDMLRMSSENGMFKQPITLGGEQKLVDVAKLGTVMLFFMTPDGDVGYAKKEGGKYVYVTESDAGRQEQILLLFDALKKQIRTGYFTIPYTANTLERK
jgi:seryl-tRNA synthetase